MVSAGSGTEPKSRTEQCWFRSGTIRYGPNQMVQSGSAFRVSYVINLELVQFIYVFWGRLGGLILWFWWDWLALWLQFLWVISKIIFCLCNQFFDMVWWEIVLFSQVPSDFLHICEISFMLNFSSIFSWLFLKYLFEKAMMWGTSSRLLWLKGRGHMDFSCYEWI